jgi:hypothetical protein
MKSLGLDDKAARNRSLLAALRDFDEARPSLPGEHWTAFGLGLYLLLRRRRTSAGRLASMVAGATLVARALSGRDGAIAVLRRTRERDAEDEVVDVAMPWPYDERVRVVRNGSSEERLRRR